MLTMSLFYFGFQPVGGHAEADTNISSSACAGDGGMSDVSAPTGSVSTTITGNENKKVPVAFPALFHTVSSHFRSSKYRS